MDADDHPAVVSISSRGTEALFAADTAAALVLWGLNFFVSMPGDDKTVFTHLVMVSLLTALCGFEQLTTSWDSHPLSDSGLLMYSLRVVTTYNLLSLEAVKVTVGLGEPGLVFFNNLVNRNM